MLAGGDGLAGDLGVRGRDGQVDDDLHARVVQHRRHVAGRGDAVLGRLLVRHLGEQVADGQQLGVGETGQVLDVGGADDAGADDADATGPATSGSFPS